MVTAPCTQICGISTPHTHNAHNAGTLRSNRRRVCMHKCAPCRLVHAFSPFSAAPHNCVEQQKLASLSKHTTLLFVSNKKSAAPSTVRLCVLLQARKHGCRAFLPVCWRGRVKWYGRSRGSMDRWTVGPFDACRGKCKGAGHALMRTRGHIHAHAHAHMLFMRAVAHVKVQFAHSCAHVGTHTHARTNTCTHPFDACRAKCKGAVLCTCLRSCAHVCARIHTHKCMYTLLVQATILLIVWPMLSTALQHT